ncbi:MAG: endopeptidase La [Candidatus Sumerlaeaceae bacterium]|nr:endopeptidase La [Candidatus Sumerlaeaceae bacterium]
MTKKVLSSKAAAAKRPTKNEQREPGLGTHELLPVIPLRDVVVFPQCVSSLYVAREKSIAGVEEAISGDKRVFLVTQKHVDVENPSRPDLYNVGTIAEILQLARLADGTLKILVEGQNVARLLLYKQDERICHAAVEPLEIAREESKEIEALTQLVLDQFETYTSLSERISDELYVSIRNFKDPVQIANSIAHYANFKTPAKQEILEAPDVRTKLEKLSQTLAADNELLELEHQIMQQVKSRISKTQKEYFLNEQLKVIERELGIDSEDEYEIEELSDRIEASKMSREAREKARRELSRLAKMAPMSPEATVSRTYIEWLVDLPWGKFTKDKTDLRKAQEILDSEHYGLTKVKDRILEFLAVHQLTKHAKGPILCLVGPPGVGKTSLARSVARALGRKFVRMSLGGVRDEAEIRGHRRTYVGSLPGRIIQGMKKAGSMNPVFLLDEIDKMSSDFRGDPASALLEVLDPEQNKAFNDHYLEADFDLSHVLFITTANTMAGIPAPLLDRMELIRIPGYTEDEKLHIALEFLVPKQIKATGLTRRRIEFTPEAIKTIIVNYTREAGVRNLEREIATICRRVAREIVTNGNKAKRIVVTAERVREYLGPMRYRDLEIEKKPEIGVATGLAWTEVGGEILPTETIVMRGRGNLLLTGQLGEVMQESAKTALSYIRSRMDELNIPRDFYRTLDIHIHIPEGAVPKDGPSAGVTMTTSLVSALTKRPVRQDVAMTGEITLRGKVLKIGGLKEKVLAAHRAHIRHVIIPQENADELEEIPAEIRNEMKFTLVDTLDEVLETALIPPPRKGN